MSDIKINTGAIIGFLKAMGVWSDATVSEKNNTLIFRGDEHPNGPGVFIDVVFFDDGRVGASIRNGEVKVAEVSILSMAMIEDKDAVMAAASIASGLLAFCDRAGEVRDDIKAASAKIKKETLH